MSIAEQLARIVAWGKTHDLDLKLRPPVSDAALRKAEEAWGEPLPEPYVALLRVADGQDDEPDFDWLLGCCRLAPLESVTAQVKEERELAEEYPPSGETDLDGHVHAGRYNAKRLPIAGTPYWDGDATFLDFDPGPAGKAGQVITLVTECDYAVMGSDLEACLSYWADCLEQGRFVWDAESRSIVPASGEGYDSHPALEICDIGYA